MPKIFKSVKDLLSRDNKLVTFVCITVGMIYLSLIPFKFKSHSLEGLKENFIQEFYKVPKLFSYGDLFSNFLLYIPFGFFLYSLFREEKKFIRKFYNVLLVWSLAVILSQFTETLQFYVQTRVASFFDVCLNSIGALVGAIFAILFFNSLKQVFINQDAKIARQKRYQLLKFYVLGFFLYYFYPFDLTIRPGEIWDKYKQGRIVLIPFSDLISKTDGLAEFIFDAFSYVPVAIFLLIFLERREFKRKQLNIIIFFLPFFVEFLQLMIFSRFASVTDLLSGTIGCFLGLKLIPFFNFSKENSVEINN